VDGECVVWSDGEGKRRGRILTEDRGGTFAVIEKKKCQEPMGDGVVGVGGGECGRGGGKGHIGVVMAQSNRRGTAWWKRPAQEASPVKRLPQEGKV